MVHKFNPESRHKLDNPQRRRLLPPAETLRRLGLKAGDSMADIGCGIGYFTLPAAQIVGSQGKIYALDIMAAMIEETKSKVRENRLTNVELLQVKENDFMLADQTVQYAFACLVAHEAEDLSAFFRETARILEPAGRVVIIEWNKQHSMMGPPLEHRLDNGDVAALLRQCGFTNIQQMAVNAEMYAVIAEREN
ncbi:MAG TPA: methyltransferase domain-containing protein [Methylomusa anaerophila]|uniref:Demethylmenaquinone methyltransferase n=1 Tax=Methylomusa anaerophila TaxID=1930071 RepID=A0A348AF09_9FIRM|nr:methyltransferase domain-containing protein [Methylomusa anaerophila]BBB89657.1 demethylmenaquinone methyltransferase [Methylomusa anaerophila]HML89567.1 methyltransferase domain-containing protein [Methylomusa anaerophila]